MPDLAPKPDLAPEPVPNLDPYPFRLIDPKKGESVPRCGDQVEHVPQLVDGV